MCYIPLFFITIPVKTIFSFFITIPTKSLCIRLYKHTHTSLIYIHHATSYLYFYDFQFLHILTSFN
ncbi:hypothetical protein Hanom_Chr07g00657451 [Helianthus anomalus]